jgi:hypothetical protein
VDKVAELDKAGYIGEEKRTNLLQWCGGVRQLAIELTNKKCSACAVDTPMFIYLHGKRFCGGCFRGGDAAKLCSIEYAKVSDSPHQLILLSQRLGMLYFHHVAHKTTTFLLYTPQVYEAAAFQCWG